MSSSARRLREPRADRLARDAHVNVLVAANRFTEGMDLVCREAGLSHSQYAPLWVLCLADGAADGLPMGAIADGLLTRASDTTRLIDRLVENGLAERLPNPSDRRGVLARATPKGRRVFAEVTPKLKAFHRAQWAALATDELETLHGLLTKALWGFAADRRGAQSA
jgi:MarR family 2-MHQ and catechol resistance regulon transcriptional repressor